MKGLEILTHVLGRSLNPTPGHQPQDHFYLRLTSPGWDVRQVRWDDWLELGNDWLELGNDDTRQGGLRVSTGSDAVMGTDAFGVAMAFRVRSCSFAGL